MTEVLPLALQYGMSVDDFWHKDKRLFDAYQKAYYTRQYETAWVNGLYVNIALCNLASNIFAKKGAKALEYPQKPYNPFEKKAEPVTKDNIEEKFRELMFNNSNWLKDRFKKKEK